jgi:hypothetical protein
MKQMFKNSSDQLNFIPMTEPDYTLTIIEWDGGFVVCEG